MAYNDSLSKQEIQEEYEDLVFRKVMAAYVEKESGRILSEIEEEKAKDKEKVDGRKIEKLYNKLERRENWHTVLHFSKKALNFAAMVVFVAIISLSSVVVASAEARESITDALYHLIYEDNERYTQITKGQSTGFIDAELYDWEGAFAPTYIPEGFVFSEKQELGSARRITYSCGKQCFIITQSNGEGNLRLDTEGAQKVCEIVINNSIGLLVEKDGISSLVWSEGETLFLINETISSGEIISVAEGMKKIK